MEKKLFGSSGIRGLANKDITSDLAQRLGKAIGTLHRKGLFIVGRDVRNTGELLEKALVSGILSCGGEVYSIGPSPTPVVAWSTKHFEADLGVAISASHNPPEYNGFKIFNENGMSLTVSDQIVLEKILEKNVFETVEWRNIKKISVKDANKPYIRNLVSKFVFKKKWSLVCNCFTGAAGIIVAQIFSSLGLKASFMNLQPDGYFPSGNPEPSLFNLRSLGKFIVETGADIGFAFDGDSDRVHVVDENGSFMRPDSLLSAFSRHVITEANGGTIVTHVGASMSIEDTVESAGGKVVRTRVGDAHITEAIEKEKAIFGGEPVGAWVYPSINMCPDGVLSALKILDALEKTGKTASEFVRGIKEYPISRERYLCKEEDKSETMRRIKENINEFFEIKAINNIDGIRVETREGWILFRPSGTEPYIRVTGEGRDDRVLGNLMRSSKSLMNFALEGNF